ncbi:D-erythronate dehydrogenase [Mesorhizobium sp. BE184]|uniref:D-erythronate dehydrogenase n=1 Tax=Mesorhizobium sp. BE184 TaxID=2817714 RepID=UPI00285B35E3|nr:D-erythronate dehydrogenase [Mesorhizobium sp. BE184]MDR7031377.1 nucleoside-diphosphate-sugar epimerase [Mesorhizobium sp. BE184]
MRILITGAAGMIGRKLTQRLLRDGKLAGKPISALILQDIVPPAVPHSGTFEVTASTGDLAKVETTDALVATRPDVVFHLAGVVSGEAEANFDLGYRVNLDGTRALFEAIRRAGIQPRVVFTSSIAVFGAPFPDIIPDDFHLTPLTSYGVQKMMSEALLADYTRKGFFDGIGIRLPTICVRPGKPNKAASGFFSGIIREPLAGMEAALPVPRSVVHTHASPRSAIGFLIHAAGLDGATVGPRRNLTMPGVGVSVGEQIEALRRIAGEDAVKLIREEPDDTIWAIVRNWPTRFAATRARELGFEAESSFDEIIRAHMEDELEGSRQS